MPRTTSEATAPEVTPSEVTTPEVTPSEVTPSEVTTPEAVTVAAGSPPAPRPPRRAVIGRWTATQLSIAAVALLLLAIGLGVLLGNLRHAPTPTAAPPVAGKAVAVNPAEIQATATSTQQPAGNVSYGIANTLDDDPLTAWNSDGDPDGNGSGISLTYTFVGRINLTSITLRNGYQKTIDRPGKTGIDLFKANERIRSLRVITDSGSWTWQPADARGSQTFTGAAGPTRSVRLEITGVYRSEQYHDLALSDLAFGATQ